MLYICDFYAHQKEAISNQIEILRKETNGTLFAAGIFMNQKFLRLSDLREKRIILPRFLFYTFLPLSILLSKNIHIFEEDPSNFQKFFLNLTKKNIYISLYRRPSINYISYLKQLKNKKKIFVEMNSHKSILLKEGFSNEKIEVFPPPTLFQPQNHMTNYSHRQIRFLFASWNKGNYRALISRGLIFLIEILSKNNHIALDIILRDKEIKLIKNIIKNKELCDRVNLIHVENQVQLHEHFKKTDFVVFLSTERITKDIPNSLIDGFACGKPCIATDIIDFSSIIQQEKIGIIIKNKEIPFISISQSQYQELSDNSFRYAQRHTKEEYKKITEFYV